MRRLAGPCFPAKLLKGAANTEDDPQAKERLKAEQEAQKVFNAAYQAQAKRIAAKLKASGGKPPSWKGEAEQLAQAVMPFYEQTASAAAQSALSQLPIDVDWDMVNEPVKALARARALLFGDEATGTSQERTAARIADWIERGGTMAELIKSVAEVWSGPRADVAAATEVTDLYSAGNLAAWQESGVVLAYNFNTAEDPLVDQDCAQAAGDGPYDLDDDDHRPPLHPNCRCWVTPVVKAPKVSSYLSGDAAKDALKQDVKLSTDEQTSINWYAGAGHDKINSALRGNTTIDEYTLDRTTSNIDRVLNRYRTSVDVELHRGMLAEDEAGRAYLEQLQPGQTYRDKGYVSTTTDKSTAGMFGYGGQGQDGTIAVSVDVRVPKGTPALHMGSARPQQGIDESEVLLGRDLEYRIVSREDTPGHSHITMEVVK